MSKILEVEREGRLHRIALNRPEKRNALSVALCREILGEIASAEADASVGAVLLEGRGESFCAGMDLQEVLELDAHENAEFHSDFFTFGRRLKKPLVACVHGAVMGGGVGLMLNAHFVAAHENTRIALTERKLGLWPYTIYAAVTFATGERKAAELALTARTIGVQEARQIGMVDVVGTNSGLEIARELANASASAIRDGMEFLQKSRGKPHEELMRAAVEGRARAQLSADFREGVMAFREKRKPEWPSHRE